MQRIRTFSLCLCIIAGGMLHPAFSQTQSNPGIGMVTISSPTAASFNVVELS